LTDVQPADSAQPVAHSFRQAQSGFQVDADASASDKKVNHVDKVNESEQQWLSTRKRRKRRSKSKIGQAVTHSYGSDSDKEIQNEVMNNAVIMESSSGGPPAIVTPGNSQDAIPPSLDSQGLPRIRRSSSKRRASGKREAKQTDALQERGREAV